MWPAIYMFLRGNVRYITLPVAIVVGYIGYQIEQRISTERHLTYLETSTEERRLERQTELMNAEVYSLKQRDRLVPKTSLDRNPRGNIVSIEE